MLKITASKINLLKNYSQIIETGSYSHIKFSDALEPFFVRKIPAWKRAMDIIGALFSLILFAPLFLLISLTIKVVSPGPVFFKQERMGYGGRRLTMIKFRTMKINADHTVHQQYYTQLINGYKDVNRSENHMLKLDKNDPQIIPFGKILRNLCLDELPQLFNVLRGEMSLVGPRPPIPYEAKEYLRWHNGRFDSVPGMTGLWQVSGKNCLTFKEMIRLDIRYAQQLSFWLDLKILLKTPHAIFRQIKDSLQSEKPKFKGLRENS